MPWRWARSWSSEGLIDELRDVSVVVPTVGRPSLEPLLAALGRQPLAPAAVVVVDDRRCPESIDVPDVVAAITTIVRSGGRGPAAARNVGWASTATPWVVFLDDDVVPSGEWSHGLAADLRVDPDVGAVQGVIRVPRASDRPLTDNERNTVALESAGWITADLAVRRSLLEDIAGFDERFPRAYREDSDFARRAEAARWRLVLGQRITEHPLRADPWWRSVTAQRGNADDALMHAIHGARWSERRGRRRRHLAITAAGCSALVCWASGRRTAACLAATCWIAGTAELAIARLVRGSRRPQEVAAMLVTSVAIPPVASSYWLLGRLRWPPRTTGPWPDAGVPPRREPPLGST